jgi:type II secretory pathway pseudopilin PulG
VKRRACGGSALVSLLLLIALAALAAAVALTAISLRASSDDTRMQDLALTQLTRTAQADAFRALLDYDTAPVANVVLLDDTPLPGTHRVCSIGARHKSLLTLTARCTQDGAARVSKEAVLAVSAPEELGLTPADSSLYWGTGTKVLDHAALDRAGKHLVCFACGGGQTTFRLGPGQGAELKGSLAALGDDDSPLTLDLQTDLKLDGALYVDGAARLNRDLTCTSAEITGRLTLGPAAVLTADRVILHTPVDREVLDRIHVNTICMADSDLPNVLPLPDQEAAKRLIYFDAGPL